MKKVYVVIQILDEIGYREEEENRDKGWRYFPEDGQILGPHSTVMSWIYQDYELEA